MIRKLLIISALTSLLLLVPACSKMGNGEDRQQVAAPPVARTVANPATKDRAKLFQEAVTALHETNAALIAIDQNKRKEAIDALERATGKLELVLARNPALALAPVDVTTTTDDLIGDAREVDPLLEAAKQALDEGRIQVARGLIDDLASETVVHVSSLPLATYPAAIKSAAALLAQNKPQEAKSVLQQALSTLVITNSIIPLPLARAEDAIDQAKGLSEKANRTEADNARLHTLLTTARGQIHLGQALGYATKQDMDNLVKAIEEIEDKTSGQRHGIGLLNHIKAMFSIAREASQKPYGKP